MSGQVRSPPFWLPQLLHPAECHHTTGIREFTVTGHLESVLKDSFALGYRKACSFVTWILK